MVNLANLEKDRVMAAAVVVVVVDLGDGLTDINCMLIICAVY